MTQQQEVIITKVTTPIATCYCATSGHLVLLHLLHGRDVLPCTSQDAATEPKHRIAWGFEHTLPPEWKCSSHAELLTDALIPDLSNVQTPNWLQLDK